jgi:hypothetical protein
MPTVGQKLKWKLRMTFPGYLDCVPRRRGGVKGPDRAAAAKPPLTPLAPEAGRSLFDRIGVHSMLGKQLAVERRRDKPSTHEDFVDRDDKVCRSSPL